MRLATIQASAIKSTFEVLKDILNDVNLYFKEDGLYLTTLDNARASLVDMFLTADNFEEYSCPEPIIAGKPHAPIANLVLERLGLERGTPGNIVVGDLPAPDRLLAAELDFDFGLVLSGVTPADEVDTCDPSPALVAADLKAMVEAALSSA